LKHQNYKKGKRGEDIAESYLIKNNFQIIEKNFSNRFGEIDIIATKDNNLHFVEVKLKVGEDFGSPEEMINKRKLHQIKRISELFLLKNKSLAEKYPHLQIDAVCIVLDNIGEVSRLNHYENMEI
jgi:putative endonuclease